MLEIICKYPVIQTVSGDNLMESFHRGEVASAHNIHFLN